MILIKVNREDMAAAARVAGNVRLNSIFLTGIQAMNTLEQGVSHSAPNMNANISHSYLGYKVLDARTLVVQIGARLELRRKTAADEPKMDSKPVVGINVVYSVSYLLPNPPIPEDIDKKSFDSFGKINGLYNCWPYLRQEIQAIAASMDFPFILPTLRIEVGSASEAASKPQEAKNLPEMPANKTITMEKRTRKRK